MGKRESGFQYDRTRLLHRSKHAEYWEGTSDGRPVLIKRFPGNVEAARQDYLLNSRVRSRLLLPVIGCGETGDGCFAYFLQPDFPVEPAAGIDRPWVFAAQVLSLSLALLHRGVRFKLDSSFLIQDRNAGHTYLPGLRALRDERAQSGDRAEAAVIASLQEILKSFAGATGLEKLLKKWERRRESALEGCLAEILQKNQVPPGECCTWFEMPRSRELEIVAGLLQFARGEKGRALLFQGDPGGGKSSLLAQISRDLLRKETLVVSCEGAAEGPPYFAIRRLLDLYFDRCGLGRADFAASKWLRSGRGAPDVPEESIVADFLRSVSRIQDSRGVVPVLLVDDLDRFDRQSLGLMSALARSLGSSPLLLIATATRSLEVPESMAVLPVQPFPAPVFENAFSVPLWSEDQRASLANEIHRRSGGNVLLYQDALNRTLAAGRDLRWSDGSWTLRRGDPPSISDSIAALYLQKLEPLSEQERRLLEVASVQGSVFDPEWLPMDGCDRQAATRSLLEKGILSQSRGLCCFVRPALADHFYERIDGSTRRDLHLQLAQSMDAQGKGASGAEIARHYLKAGKPEDSLEHACRSAASLRWNTSQILLPVFEELEEHAALMPPGKRLILYQRKAELLFRCGRFAPAAAAFRQALALAGADAALSFDLRVRIAECLGLGSDIHGALLVLRDAAAAIDRVRNPELLMRYYFCRGTCLWQRGDPADEDFALGLKLAEQQQDQEWLSSGYRRLAEQRLRAGDLAGARGHALRALRHAQKARIHVEAGQALRILGVIRWRGSRHRAAERTLRAGIRHFRRGGSLDGIARLWSILGSVYMEQCRFEDATAAFRKSSAFYSQLEHPLQVSLAQFNMGLVYAEQAKLKEAERIFQRCAIQDRKGGHRRYYAYDLRALAVVCVLRGFHRKAASLLQRAHDIFSGLQSGDDLLQTCMIQLMNELEQSNFMKARPLVEFLQERLPSVLDPMERGEIHYLLGHYSGYINETAAAIKHLNESLRLSRKIGYHKLSGMSLILRLIFRGSAPAAGDADLRRAIGYFQKSRNELRLSDYLLRLYQAYPSLLRRREHARRLDRMEKLYRQIRHRARHRLVRRLALDRSRASAPEPLYDSWLGLFQTLHGEGGLEERLEKTLALLGEELHASSAGFWLLDGSGSLHRFDGASSRAQAAAREFHDRVWKKLSAGNPEPLMLNPAEQADWAADSWVQLHEIRSLLVVPLLQDRRLVGMWYFERWNEDAPFLRKELDKAAFFSILSRPALLHAVETLGSQEAPEPGAPSGTFEFVGRSSAIQNLKRQIARLAPLDISVLILGESGTGKELIARALHLNSSRKEGPFLTLNCSAIPESLIESELFGHAKGAFTGASMTRQGYVEQASGGTLFLDEIGDLSPAAQAKLLRVMQEKEIYRVGETTPRRIDVRFLFATHRDLKKMAAQGSYREDLYYRISSYVLGVPPLRERRDDIPLLVQHFTDVTARAFGRGRVSYAPAAMQTLCEYPWPGNIRELQNTVQSLLVNIEAGSRVDTRDLPPQLAGASAHARSGQTLELARQEFERDFLAAALKRHGWNKTRTARELGITRQGLIQMMQRLGIHED